MNTAYIQSIDITKSGKVIVSGQRLGNLCVALRENIPIQPPTDGIWDYDLDITTSVNCATIMKPFMLEAPWIGDENANGLRITQNSLEPTQPDRITIQLKGKKVSNFTSTQENQITLKGAAYDLLQKQLIIDVLYSGGWFSHLFSLEWDGQPLESYPLQYNFNLVDLSEYDAARSIETPQLRFDISTPDFQIDIPSEIIIRTPGYGKTLRLSLKNL